MPHLPVLLVPSRGVQRISTLSALLGEFSVVRGGRVPADAGEASVLAWGRKPSASRAENIAQRLKLPLLCAEDGFLRSFGTGDCFPPLSLVVDDEGIYYDSTCPSA
jgi:capsular polysaccharide export protein